MTAEEKLKEIYPGIFLSDNAIVPVILTAMREFAREKATEAIETVLDNIELYNCNNFHSLKSDPYLSTDVGWYVVADIEKARNSYNLQTIR